MRSRKAILYLPPYAHEHDRLKTIEAALESEASKLGIRAISDTVVRKAKPSELPLGSIVVADSPIRFGRNVGEVSSWLGAALQRGVNVLIPGFVTLQTTDPDYRVALALLDMLNRTAQLHRAKRVSEGVFLARQRGTALGRPRMDDQTRDLICDTFDRLGSIRGTVRSLKTKGVEVGRATVQRVVTAAKRDRGGSK